MVNRQKGKASKGTYGVHFLLGKENIYYNCGFLEHFSSQAAWKIAIFEIGKRIKHFSIISLAQECMRQGIS